MTKIMLKRSGSSFVEVWGHRGEKKRHAAERGRSAINRVGIDAVRENRDDR